MANGNVSTFLSMITVVILLTANKVVYFKRRKKTRKKITHLYAILVKTSHTLADYGNAAGAYFI